MICFPNAKINIGLFITGKRDDGYHNLETIFYPVKQYRDVLEIVPSEADTAIHLSGLSVAGNKEDNLVWKAYCLLQKYFPQKITTIQIYLHKAIPMGAGMGGGSADGAFMLRLMNDFFELGLTQKELLNHALTLGSDVPFFIKNTPQFAGSRGEKMQQQHLDLSAFEIKIITHDIAVSTKQAFQHIKPLPASFDLKKISVEDIAHWKQYVKNDFEETVFHAYPELKKAKEKLYDEGAVYASMTGTGSAIYGIFKK